jgi:putative ATP-binding cassette transporter
MTGKMRGLKPFLRDAWRLALPYFRSEERWSARGLLGIIIVMNLALVGMNVVLNFWNREFFNALQNKDWDGFIQLLFLYRHTDSGLMPGFVEVVVAFVGLAVCRSYLQQWLQIRWRRWMTGRLLNQWLTDQAYYRLSLTCSATRMMAGQRQPDGRSLRATMMAWLTCRDKQECRRSPLCGEHLTVKQPVDLCITQARYTQLQPAHQQQPRWTFIL